MEFLKQTAEREDLTEVMQKLGAVAAEVLDCGSLRLSAMLVVGGLLLHTYTCTCRYYYNNVHVHVHVHM